MKNGPTLELLPHELNKMKKFKIVRPEDFDVEMLLAAAQERRLYIEDNIEEIDSDTVKSEVRAYVGRIKEFVTPKFSSSIDDLWEKILNTDDFLEFLKKGRGGRKYKAFNKYNLMRIIGVLREKSVYEERSYSKYSNLLEQTNEDTPYRKYLGMGIEFEMLKKLREILGSYKL